MVRWAIKLINRYKRLVKFGIAGMSATLTQFIILYTLTELGLWYLASTSLGFIVAFFISFFLQKFWTFRDTNRDKMYSQMAVYLAAALIGLLFNAGGMYVLVEYANFWYILAQMVMVVFIATCNFFVYKFLIFKNNNETRDPISGAEIWIS